MSPTKSYLGVDVGTFETKGVLVDDAGTVLAMATRGHGISTPADGHVEQDADLVWWAEVAAVCRDLMASDGAKNTVVQAMAVSAIGPCVLPIDENLRPLRPGILYGVDTRANEEIELLRDRLGDEEISRRSGNSLTSQSAGPKIMWISRNEPEVAAKTRWYVTSQSYLVAKLTGEVTMDHGTAGYFHPLYDLGAQQWDVAGCEDFVELAQLPRVTWATEIAGTVTPEASVETGVPEGVPVLVGTTDSPAEAVGAGVVAAGDIMMQYGSAGYMINVLAAPQPSADLWAAPFVFPGTFVAAAGTATAGTITRWVADLLDLDSTQGDAAMFSALIELAQQSPPGARGLLMLPHFSGERTPLQDPLARGVIHGLTLGHTRADVARAAIEGIAHSLSHAFLSFDDAGLPTGTITAIGGGTKNSILLASVSAVTGKDQVSIESVGAAFGDAVLAAYASGRFSSPQECMEWIRVKARQEPDPAISAVLVADHADYRELYEATRQLSHRRAVRG
ncbi:xylulokinase [Pontimonas salivibrio]|uniref:Xylulokinase n=1 Tax=Pontimonas salivibrio TaxID=1159327 RepID=A0A2L2BRB1_9MICO|nr:FGGY family carbohydrate kinase [Pontimonas salivibrio]AVG24201.1 xylulokinase [Pontimonas salivibrio]